MSYNNEDNYVEEDEFVPRRQKSNKRRRKPKRRRFDPSDDGFQHSNSTTAPSFLKQEMKDCLGILEDIMAQDASEPFNQPVDWQTLGIPDYPKIIKKPMDLGTIKEIIYSNQFSGPEHFAEHVRLVFKNAMTYNRNGSPIYLTAQSLLDQFEEKYEALVDAYFEDEADDDEAVTPPKPKRRRKGGSKLTSSAREDAELAAMKKSIRELQANLRTIKRTIASLQAAQNGNGKKKGSGGGGNRSKKAAQVKKIKLKEPKEETKPLSYEQKELLCQRITNLSQDYLPGLLEVINSTKSNDGDEVEIDIEKLDDATLIKIQSYLNECAAKEKQKKAGMEDDEALKQRLRESEAAAQQRILEIDSKIQDISN